ncbi:MAG: hypothetical protein INH41_11395 [Myxococcaceae bacterium]|nr:hypothetical protein [Myxococcaceae bacterium]
MRLTVKVVPGGIPPAMMYRPFPHHPDEAFFVLGGAVTMRLVGERPYLQGQLQSLHQLRFLRAH